MLKDRTATYLTRSSWICLFWMLLCISLVLADPILDTVIEGIKFNDSLLKDINARYRLKQNFKPESLIEFPMVELPNGRKKVYDQRAHRIVIAEWVLKGNKIRMRYTMSASNEIEGNYEVLKEETVIFDGSKSLMLEMGVPSWRGKIKMGNQIHGILDPLDFGYNCRKKLLSEVLAENQVILRGKEQISGAECYVVEVTSPEEWKSIWWIDPSSGFRIRKLENYGKDGNMVVHLEFTNLVKYGEVWFPTGGKIYTGPKKRSDGTLILGVETELVVDEAQINKGVSDALFEMVWPSGTSVYDYILGMGFNVP